ncbi:MAG TPA: lytic transglycosylase domain-containing protein [Rhizomicrobium sp.]|nr:lytic transglycosylase domain-containing protein [Rhizomicrobium sp.]
MGRKLLLAAAMALLSAPALAQSALPAVDGGEAGARLRVLSSEDVHRYRVIFEDERSGDFAGARAEIAKLNDTSLMGYILAEHYLSPHSKRTPVADLNDWMQQYGDLSIADRVYALANKRARRKHIAINDIPSFRRRGGGYEDADLPDPPMISEASRTAQLQIEQMIHDSQPGAAAMVLQTLASSGQANAVDIARLSQRVAASYLAEGFDQQAFDIASPLAGTTSAPMLDWSAGFAAYRLGKFADAAPYLERLAQNGSVPSYTRASAAFWAARAHLQAGDPLRVVTLLMAAAREEPTFYGLLAERLLGEDTQTGFSDPVLNADTFLSLMQVPAAHRAVALWQVGRIDDVPNEINRAFSAADYNQGAGFAALARAMNLPNLELRASETAASRGLMLTGLFPVPNYAPEGGYHVDPSLVLAFARIESRFEANATSSAGARGLMQLMPGTAKHLGGGDLEDPSANLALGQRYIAELLDQLNGNLLQLAAAYNAGPANLSRWLSVHESMRNDPLLFIESIPASQTRNYVKRLMTYHWMYRRRMNVPSPTLDQTAAGGWPRYDSRGAAMAKIPAVQSYAAASH